MKKWSTETTTVLPSLTRILNGVIRQRKYFPPTSEEGRALLQLTNKPNPLLLGYTVEEIHSCARAAVAWLHPGTPNR
jgi:hypothetical protein